MKLLCSVFKSAKVDAMYLYVDKQQGLARVPQELLESFGKPIHALTFILSSGRRLAKEDADKVLRNIQKRGYHLQYPPGRADPVAMLKAAIPVKNS